MELRSENHKDIALFFSLFNEILSTVRGVPNYKFNPRYFVCDEAGANYKAITKLVPEDQDTFVKTCYAMCDVTTVADYNRLKQVLDDLAERNPEIKPFAMYWDPRRSHIFKPFRGSGLLGVNMSEQGNVTSQTMRLVYAAKYDVATMFKQEKEIELFEHNLLKCAGRGQSAGVRNSKDRAQQIKVAEDFVNILDHEEDVLAEAEQGNKPSMFIPKSDAKHRAPKKRFTTKKPTGGPQRKVKKAQEVEDLSKKLEDKLALALAMAMAVCDSELTST